jgi:RsiW-degrading membrane proteinase PrsW (M82 family)
MDMQMAVISTPTKSVWPILPSVAYSDRDRSITYVLIGLISFASIGLGFLLQYIAGRIVFDTVDYLLACSLSVLGFLIIVIAHVQQLQVFNALWTGISYTLMAGLLFGLLALSSELADLVSSVGGGEKSARAMVSFFNAAFLEEVIKMACYLAPVLIFKRYRNVYDIAYLAVFSGCSFAVLENVLYSYAGLYAVRFRFIWCTMLHACLTLIGAMIIAFIKTRSMRFGWVLYPFALIVPVGLHGAYDYVCMDPAGGAGTVVAWIFIGALVALIGEGLLYMLRREALKQNAVIMVPVCHVIEF